ncbi:MAG TPA: carbon-nitrogen hydrolase family protein [Verrucomicrobiae bacterium]|nr:carbon-nitrogen hydrolase family protein [Verrucomicrobiae bacterium]
MTRSIRVAAVQLRAHDHAGFAGALPGILEAAAEAANGAELVVLPEGTLPAYVLGEARVDSAAVESALARFAQLAERTRTVFVVGAATGRGPRPRNAAVVIDRDGTIAGQAEKFFLWHFDRRWFEAGERIEPIATSIGRIGALVCADGRIPTLSRLLVDRGAELLVMPTAWVTSGRDPAVLENAQADLLAGVRAFENGVPFVAANKCGAELGIVAYCGKSQILDARGDAVAIGPQREPAIVKGTIEIGEPQPYRIAAAHPNPRGTQLAAPLRVAISPAPLPADIDARLELLDDAFALAPGDEERFSALDRAVAAVRADDATMLDPAGLVGYRRSGYRLAVWTTQLEPALAQRIARARAIELRLYVVVFEGERRRAYAVDPDGAIVCGTFDGFAIASFLLDPQRIAQTAVAPGTDVSDGLERVAALSHREEAVR